MLKKWKMPSFYYGATWEEYYVGLGKNRDSDTLTRSNFDVCLERLGGETETVQVVSENHWAVGWVEWIAIHESDKKALDAMRDMFEKLENYPVLDEEHFCEAENDEAQEIWRNCYSDRERLAYIKKHGSQFGELSFTELRENVRGEYFSGYASELCM